MGKVTMFWVMQAADMDLDAMGYNCSTTLNVGTDGFGTGVFEMSVFGPRGFGTRRFRSSRFATGLELMDLDLDGFLQCHNLAKIGN
jgi:hypothetical protein